MDSSVSAADQSSNLFENEFCTADDSSIEGCSQYLHQVGENGLFFFGGGGLHTHYFFLSLKVPGNITWYTGTYLSQIVGIRSANTECFPHKS